ncbi:hypothetical protein DFP72DRAFT_1081838 [Ephemerocybe angulata]|uniref:Uncharacterized protein n=1 Tax=Ephemerocybe angulata TaxID=980116 RepID=A0A8H6LUC7_9AGAR|nr:hypothetical protein DFP72DRAFT_1081838 [Tulosesus angulatus]
MPATINKSTGVDVTKYIRHLPDSLEDVARIRALAEDRVITLEKEIENATGRVKTRLGSALKNVRSNITNLTLQYNLLAAADVDAMDVDQEAHPSQISVEPIPEAPIPEDASQGDSVACADPLVEDIAPPVALDHPVDSLLEDLAPPVALEHPGETLSVGPDVVLPSQPAAPADHVASHDFAEVDTEVLSEHPVSAPINPAPAKSLPTTPEPQQLSEPVTIVQDITLTGNNEYRITTTAIRSPQQAPAGADVITTTIRSPRQAPAGADVMDVDDELSDRDAEGENDPDAAAGTTLVAGPSTVRVTMVKQNKNDPPVRTHLPEYWERLTNTEKRNILDHAKAQLQKFYKTNTPLRDSIRAWSRRHSEFLPISAMHSRKLALSMFILNNGRTCCHYHVHLDRTSAVNDVAVNESDSPQPFCVTGVPYEPNPNPIRHPNYLQRDPDDLSGGRNPNFTLERVYEFFPLMDEETGERALHCGCPMEEALIDFYFWKVVQIESHSYEAIETMGRGIKPRDRLYYLVILRLFNIQLDDLFQYDTDDRAIDTVDARLRQIKVWEDAVKDIQDTRNKKKAEKEKERKRLAQQKLARAYKEIEELEGGEVDFDDDDD